VKFFFIILFFLSVFSAPLYAQQQTNDTIPTPSEARSPKKASVYSAILPGLGQAYNKKYWKIPVIYVGFGVIIYYIDWNNDWYKLFKNAYKDLSVTEDFDRDAYVARYEKLPYLETIDYTSMIDIKNTQDYLLKYNDYFRRNRDLLIIGTAVFYALNIIDASVDAHLSDFDISDDLSLNWRPAVTTIENQRYLCFNCFINF